MRKFLGVSGTIVIILSIIYVARPSPHIPPYDANLVRLAETELEGWCAGTIFWSSRGEGNPEDAKQCRAKYVKIYSSKYDMTKVENAFCFAIIKAGWSGSKEECLDVVRGRQLWPTYDGNLSGEWNRARPYPGIFVPTQSEYDESRTGEREPPKRYHPDRSEIVEPVESPSPEEASPTPSPTGGDT